MFSYFENRKTTYFDVFFLNFSIGTKIKTLFQISYFNLSKKTKWHFGTRIVLPYIILCLLLVSFCWWILFSICFSLIFPRRLIVSVFCTLLSSRCPCLASSLLHLACFSLFFHLLLVVAFQFSLISCYVCLLLASLFAFFFCNN